MINGHQLDVDFEKINELFFTYTRALSNLDDKSLRLELRGKIIVAFWKALQKSSSVTSEMIEHTDLLVKKVDYCIEKCSKDFDFHEFAKYTYSSIKKALALKADTNAFEEKSGMHISDGEDRKRRKIEKAYKQYMSFGKRSDSDFIEYAANYLGFQRTDIIEYIVPKTTGSLFVKSSKDEEEFCIADKVVGAKINEIENKTLNTDELTAFLKKINLHWKNQKASAKLLLSELITRDILDNLSHNNLTFAVSDKEEIETLFSNYEFLSKSMIHNYFTDINYKLPSQQDIANNYKLTKSAVSKKLSRFFENQIED